MKTLKKLITEKILINKDTEITIDSENRLIYAGIVDDIVKKSKMPKNEVKNMLNQCSNNITKYKFIYLDVHENYNKLGYKTMFDMCADLVNHPSKKYHLTDKIFSNAKFGIYEYLHKNINLSNDDGNEYYIIIIDSINDVFYVYEILNKDGNNWIKNF